MRTWLKPLALSLLLPGCWIYTEKDNASSVDIPDATIDAATGGHGDAATGGASTDAGRAGDAAPQPETCVERRATYPAGPYAKGIDDTIKNLSFVGSDGTPVDFESLRADCKYKLAIVTTSAGWCTACREEQPKIQKFFDDYASHGVLVVVTLFEDDNYDPADADLAAGWKSRYDLTFPVLADPEFGLGAYYDRDQTPMIMVLDLEHMQIKHLMNGFVDSDVRSLINGLL